MSRPASPRPPRRYTFRKLALIAAAASASALAGCAGDPLSALGIPPLQRPPAATVASGSASQPPRPAARDECFTEEFVAPVDVDTAYARVRSQMRFRTVEERRQFAERHSSGFIDDGFRHVAQSGAFYEMHDLIGWNDANGKRQAAWMTMRLAKDGPARTNVRASYCLRTAEPGFADANYRESIRQRMRAAVLN